MSVVRPDIPSGSALMTIFHQGRHFIGLFSTSTSEGRHLLHECRSCSVLSPDPLLSTHLVTQFTLVGVDGDLFLSCSIFEVVPFNRFPWWPSSPPPFRPILFDVTPHSSLVHELHVLSFRVNKRDGIRRSLSSAISPPTSVSLPTRRTIKGFPQPLHSSGLSICDSSTADYDLQNRTTLSAALP